MQLQVLQNLGLTPGLMDASGAKAAMVVCTAHRASCHPWQVRPTEEKWFMQLKFKVSFCFCFQIDKGFTGPAVHVPSPNPLSSPRLEMAQSPAQPCCSYQASPSYQPRGSLLRSVSSTSSSWFPSCVSSSPTCSTSCPSLCFSCNYSPRSSPCHTPPKDENKLLRASSPRGTEEPSKVCTVVVFRKLLRK